MKKAIYAILAVMPFTAFAQPTIQKAMDYTPGTTLKMAGCNHIAPGPAGANQTWDMSALVANDSTTFEYYTPGITSPVPGATIVEKSSDTVLQYYNKANGNITLVGMVDSSTANGGGTMLYSNSALQVKNPLTYGLHLQDTFENEFNIPGFAIYGKGTVDIKADGYGTLKLPGGIHYNVLRLRIERNETDSVPPPINMKVDIKLVTYMWFDTANTAPICRVDSSEFDGQPNDPSAAYLMYRKTTPPPAAIGNVNNYKADFTATFNQNQLVLNSNFNKTKQYEVALFNMSGQKIFGQSFRPGNTKEVFNIDTDILPGIYMVYMQEKGNPATASIVKLARQ